MNSMKLRLLLMGCILIILGTALHFRLGGSIRTLILDVVGIVFLAGGIIYQDRAEQKVVTE